MQNKKLETEVLKLTLTIKKKDLRIKQVSDYSTEMKYERDKLKGQIASRKVPSPQEVPALAAPTRIGKANVSTLKKPAVSQNKMNLSFKSDNNVTALGH